jgi:hypothetical protein
MPDGNGMDYIDWLSDEYGDVVKVKGLGVRQIFITAYYGLTDSLE